MNAQARSIDFPHIEHIDPFDTIDPEITFNARGLHRVYRWVFFPYGWWEEVGGSVVIFDRRFHPLCRKRTDGSIEVLPMEDINRHRSIQYQRQSFIYYGNIDHPCENKLTQRKLLAAVQRLGIEDEISRRYAAYHYRKVEARRRFLRLCR